MILLLNLLAVDRAFADRDHDLGVARVLVSLLGARVRRTKGSAAATADDRRCEAEAEA